MKGIRWVSVVAVLALLLIGGLVGTAERWVPAAAETVTEVAMAMPELAAKAPSAAEGILGLSLALPVIVLVAYRREVQERFRNCGRAMCRLLAPRLLLCFGTGTGFDRDDLSGSSPCMDDDLDTSLGRHDHCQVLSGISNLGEHDAQQLTRLARGTTTAPMTAHQTEVRPEKTV